MAEANSKNTVVSIGRCKARASYGTEEGIDSGLRRMSGVSLPVSFWRISGCEKSCYS